jgi:3-hydroxyisobutyrate dehydrogenase
MTRNAADLSEYVEGQPPGRQIGMIGLGNMGSRMAHQFVSKGQSVIGFDPNAELSRTDGVTRVDSVAEVIARADYVLLSLPDSKVIDKVISGEGGIRSHCRPGQVVIDLSTASPASTEANHRLLAEAGVELIDAGISGGAAAAGKGTLIIMAGASESRLHELSWLFDSIASHVFSMGACGSGHTAKLLNNFLNAVTLAATAEVMVAGKKAGLDLKTLLEVLNLSSGMSFATKNRFPHIIEGDYLEGGLTSALMTKDIVLYVDHVGELGVPCLNASGPLATFGLANNLGYADLISNRVVDALGDVAGGVRVHDVDGGFA